jgi:hypothetical protein
MQRKLFSRITVLIDWILFSAALLAILYLALEDLGLNLPVIISNFPQLAFVGVCLLIISTIWERRMILADVDQKLDNLLAREVSASMTIKSRENEYPLMDFLEGARSASFMGATLSTTIQQYRDEFIELARDGKTLRFLLVDPALYANEREEKRLLNRGALLQFKQVLQKAPPGKVEVRLLNRYPPNKLTLIQGRSAQKSLGLVEMFGYQASKTGRPYFVLYPDKDAEWFKYFNQMFETMWTDARPISETDIQ